MKGNPEFDVAIVGAGPAGSSAAIRLARNGLRVALVEQKRFPREKLCGEFISPECITHFAELNIIDEMTLAGGTRLGCTVFYARTGSSVTVPSEWFGSGSQALGLSRAKMDDLLIKRARSVGAEVMEETYATGPLLEQNRVRGVRLKDSARQSLEITATLTIDATGRSRILARQFEKNEKRKRAEFVAFKTHLTGANVPDGHCEIYSYRGGYGGCSGVEGERHNLCFIVSSKTAKFYGSDAGSILRNIVFTNKRAARSLKDALVVDDWLAVPIESYGRAKIAPADGLLTTGDAAGFIDPFTGSGILLALESAKIAALAITKGLSKPKREHTFTDIAAEYASLYSLAFDRRLRVCSWVRHAAFAPFFAETVINVLGLSKRLTRRLAEATRRRQRSPDHAEARTK